MKKPIFRFNFWVYLMVGIVGAGGTGIWVSFLNTVDSLPDTLIAMFTFFPATAVASCMEFIFEDSEKKFVKGFAIISAFILFLLAVFIYLLSSYLLALIACISSVVLWWLANAENPKLSDIAKPLSAVGGDTNDGVSGNAGEIVL
jgi:hypothetical protein